MSAPRRAVDPELAVLVRLASEAPELPMERDTVKQLRELSRAAAIAYGPGPKLARVEDRAIPGGRGAIPVRIYHPDAEPIGVLVFFHGSGFVIFDLDTHDRECRLLARGARVVVVSVDYALAPENPFPAAFDDGVAATCWVAANRAELGVPRAAIAVGGDSAGGNLAAAVSAELRGDRSCEIRSQMLVYPVTDLANRARSYAENGQGYLLTAAAMEFFIDCYTPERSQRLDPRASPLLAPSFADLPRTLMITAELDPLRDEGEAYARALEAAGVDVTLIRYDGAVHGFFQMSNFSALGRRAIERCAEFLTATLTQAPSRG
jgi:acetyl esterase